MSTYIIPDTHGCLITLRHLLEEEIGVSKDDTLYFLGDYIDRGLYSAQLVEYLINLKDNGYRLNCLRGNHEQLLLDAMKGIANFNIWMHNDGNATLKSYKEMLSIFFTFPNDLPDRHLLFFSKLPYHFEIGSKYLLVHGGFNYTIKNPFKDKEAMLWNRSQKYPKDFMPEKVIIHGHTTELLSTIESIVNNPESRLIPLDAGCVYGDIYKGLGYLVALELDTFKLFRVKKMESHGD